LSFRNSRDHLTDILDGIRLIETFIAGLDLAVYRDDIKTKSAVERQLQIITEAAYRLGDDASAICPGPDWKGLRAMGNILRHGYHKVDDQVVWDTLKDDLPLLKESAEASLLMLKMEDR